MPGSKLLQLKLPACRFQGPQGALQKTWVTGC